MAPPPDLSALSLAEIVQAMEAQKLPPVALWNPTHCGDSEMRIARDGTWYHQGAPIRRPAMVRLFSTVLRREADGRHMLVTPVEKLEIDVDATAFRAVEMTTEGDGRERRIALGLDCGDPLIVGREHPLKIVPTAGGPSPRILVRHGLEAELVRSVYYELAELALDEGTDPLGLWSNGTFFPLEAS